MKAKDYSTKSKEKKEYIIYLDDWFGKNWLGQKVNPISENIEGVYMEQEKEPIIKQSENSGPEIVGYRRSGEHPVHYIEFSKDAVDKIIANSSSEKDEIIFVVKAPPLRDHFTYDEFFNYSWDQLEDILMQTGGAKAARAKRALEG